MHSNSAILIVQRLWDKWCICYANDDWDGLALDVYGKNAAVMATNVPIINDTKSIKEIFSSTKKSGIKRFEIYCIFAKQLNENNIIERARYFCFDDNNMIIDEGHEQSWFEKDLINNCWKVKGDIFNSAIPKNIKLNISLINMKNWSNSFMSYIKNKNHTIKNNINIDQLFEYYIIIKHGNSYYSSHDYMKWFDNINLCPILSNITSYEIIKIAQNQLIIKFIGGQIKAYLDFCSQKAWKIICETETHLSKL